MNNDLVNNNDKKAGLKRTFSEEKLRSLILKKIRTVYIPTSVYRIQLNRQFTFKDAEKIIPYLKELGIDAVYCSPYFQATPGSLHGYNVTDPNQINPEIGSYDDYLGFCNALTYNSMGHILDIVPNHMGVAGNNNLWWQDVLENGQCSSYCQYFDIDWKSIKQELTGKVLLPVLGNFYGRVLENQEILLNFQNGNFFVSYFNHKFPLDPKTYPIILADEDKGFQQKMGLDNPDYLELLSIMTAFKNLPSNTETAPEKIFERYREKEIAKQRLSQLTEHSENIRIFIENNILKFNGKKDEPVTFDRLDQLLNLQAYRLSYWLVASQEINYRRFFDINELAALRIEDEKVFLHYHDLLFKLITDGKINGLRIDHPDGLYDPPAYFKRLQREYLYRFALKEFLETDGNTDEVDAEAVRQALDKLITDEFITSPAFYVIAEKILEHYEMLPENWLVHGTVGYDYLNALNGLFVDRRNDKKFAKLYERFIGHSIDFDTLVYNKKKFFGLVPMASEINSLGHRLDRISETNRKYRDFTRNDLTVAIREVIAGFPVYRTYVSPESLKVSDKDEKNIRTAISKAREKTPMLNSAVYDFLQDALLLRLNTEPGSEEYKLYKDFLLRFQQLTGPIMAKGVEDTSFYVYNRLSSLNEVGGDPFYFGYTIKDFHQHNLSRSKRWPCSMITTSTHDTKRSEDLRMRINVLSEIPDEWTAKIKEWSALNCQYKTMNHTMLEPRCNTEYFIYQTLIGAWDDGISAVHTNPAFVERIWQYILKSIREAKIYTSWTMPDTDYENAVKKFTESILIHGIDNGFLDSFTAFQKKISFLGKLNSLSATVIKIGSPGVVDIYQGNEIWNYCLVDPDNRQLIDFELRQNLLTSIKEKILINNPDKVNIYHIRHDNLDYLKLLYTMKSLVFRRKNKELFTAGEYIPVNIKGPRENNVIAFICRQQKNFSITVAGRFFTEWPLDEKYQIQPNFWEETELILPKDIEFPDGLINVITEERITVIKKDKTMIVRLADLFQKTCACILNNIEEKK